MDRSEPAKWLKYRKLVEYGLADQEHLEREICRFPWKRRFDVVGSIARELQAQSSGCAQLYIVKFVPMDLPGQLPNVRIQCEDDLAILCNELSTRTGYSEVWYCHMNVSDGVLSVAGRLSHSPCLMPQAQIIEQVWKCSPRMIEAIGYDFAFPYVRASRPDWAWRFAIDQAYIPSSWPSTKEALLDEFYYSVRVIEQARERLDSFWRLLSSFGFRSFSIEYKIIGSDLQIIDWDTPDDLRIIDSI